MRGIPGVAEKRAALLPLGTQFAALPREARAKYEHASSFYAFGWSHGKEKLEGRPDYAKGSFYANPQARRALAIVSLTCARGATHPWEPLSPRARAAAERVVRRADTRPHTHNETASLSSRRSVVACFVVVLFCCVFAIGSARACVRRDVASSGQAARNKTKNARASDPAASPERTAEGGVETTARGVEPRAAAPSSLAETARVSCFDTRALPPPFGASQHDRPFDDEDVIAKHAPFAHPNIWPVPTRCF